jgi:hypothetical protein
MRLMLGVSRVDLSHFLAASGLVLYPMIVLESYRHQHNMVSAVVSSGCPTPPSRTCPSPTARTRTASCVASTRRESNSTRSSGVLRNFCANGVCAYPELSGCD